MHICMHTHMYAQYVCVQFLIFTPTTIAKDPVTIATDV